MVEIMQQFIEKCYINPIIYNSGYNHINTITWFTIIVISIFLALKLFPRIDVKIDDYFIIATAPYIVFGSILKVLEDTGTIQPPLNYLLMSPIFYGLTLVITILSIVFAKIFAPKLNIHDWRILFSGIGIVLTIFNIALLLSIQDIMHPGAFLMIFSFGVGMSLVIYAIGRYFSISFITDKLNAIIIFSFLLKASSTYIGVEFFGYYSKTLGILFGKNIYLNLISLIPSLIIVILFLYFLDTKLKNNDTLRNIIKLFMLVIWITPALRTTARIVIGL
ncbi:MAG: DUF63 family protein [Methanosarcinales archaeon]|nr:MAG: DUF63 family protein [Methanosarcinales archaeon]